MRIAAALLAVSSAAVAQESDVRYADANADRIVLNSTAETHPAGTVFFSDYEIIFLELGYAVTDSFQIGITGVPPMFSNQPYFVDVSGKLNLLRTSSFRAAALVG